MPFFTLIISDNCFSSFMENLQISFKINSPLKTVYKVIFLLFVLLPFLGHSQNLVPNGDFEEYVACPDLNNGYNIENCTENWFSPGISTPDYFNSCSQQLDMYGQTSLSTPLNGHGFQEPNSGEAYIGLITGLISEEGSYYEYASTKLSEPLEAQRYYRIEYYISLADSIWWDNGVDHLQYFDSFGAAISKNSPNELYYGVPTSAFYSWPAQMRSEPGVFLNDSLGWQKVEGIIVASGGEEYLTIGCFNKWDEVQTNYHYHFSSLIETYYFIDDVSLTPLDSFAAITSFPNVFSPNGDQENDQFTFHTGNKKGSMTITNRWGNTVFHSDLPFSWDGTTSDGQECTEGVYYYIFDSESESKSGMIHLLR
ncbi:hypothetical protein D3C71_1124830 [compost metagenome]